MREEEWILITEDEEGARRVPAKMLGGEGGVYRFTAAGAAYTVQRGAALRIACEGELCYELELDLLRATAAELSTPYGSLPVEVRTHSLSFPEEGGFEAEYTLCLAGQPSRRKIACSPARAGSAAEQAGKAEQNAEKKKSAPVHGGADKEGI